MSHSLVKYGPPDFLHRSQRFAHKPSLRGAIALHVRPIGVGNLEGMTKACAVTMGQQRDNAMTIRPVFCEWRFVAHRIALCLIQPLAEPATLSVHFLLLARFQRLLS